MGTYHVAFTGRPGINAVNSPIVDLWAIGRKLRVKEVGIFIQATPTQAPAIALQRATVRGTATVSLRPHGNDADDPVATALLDTTWSANPQFNTAAPFLRAGSLVNAIGNGFIWTLDGLSLPVGQGLAIFNTLATGNGLGSYNGYMVYEE